MVKRRIITRISATAHQRRAGASARYYSNREVNPLLTEHARAMLDERGITEEWVLRTAARAGSDRAGPEPSGPGPGLPGDPGTRQSGFACGIRAGGLAWQVITAFFDRGQRR